MKVFISYHRIDTEAKNHIVGLLEEHRINYYSVPEDYRYNGLNHQHIASTIGEELQKCDILLCVVGQETYSRPHVDLELHAALKGEVGVRKGIVAVMLEKRGDSKNNINWSTFPVKLADNIHYIVLEQYATIQKKLYAALIEANEKRNNKKLQTNHKNPVMKLRDSKYYDVD